MKKNIRTIVWCAVIALLVFIAIPITHIYVVKFQEHDCNTAIPHGYTNDASQLNLTRVDTIIAIATTKAEMESQIRDLIQQAKDRNIPVSIAGAKHSMGGHTMYPNGILLNMLPYKHIEVHPEENTVTVGAGALWEDVIEELNKYGKSVKVMQAFSSFSVGGSISVNGHGWQKNVPPVSSTVRSMRVMDAEGKIITCSKEENTELFRLVIGGYGLFAIILEATLDITDNSLLKYTRYEMESSDYLSYFKQYAIENPRVELVFGRLNISHRDFLEKATLNTFSRQDVLPDTNGHNAYSSIPTETKRLVFRSTVNSEYGKRLRWDLETLMGKFGSNQLLTRNQLLNDHVSLIENKDSTSTDILQEYFIPERNFNAYIQEMKDILPHKTIDLLNITIRDVQKDEVSFLNYAQEHVFGFVFLFNQLKTQEAEQAMKSLTQQLTQLAIKHGGTFYLPYRLHNNASTMRQAYPQADQFFRLKTKFDPEGIFNNQFYDHYKR